MHKDPTTVVKKTFGDMQATFFVFKYLPQHVCFNAREQFKCVNNNVKLTRGLLAVNDIIYSFRSSYMHVIFKNKYENIINI